MDGTIVYLDVDWIAFKDEKGNKDIMECLDLLERYELKNIDNFKINDKVLGIVKKLENKKLAIFSKNTRMAVEKVLEKLKLNFNMVVTINDIEKPKPDPEGIEKIIKELKISKEKTVYIGDRNIDKIAGDRAGVKTIMVNEL